MAKEIDRKVTTNGQGEKVEVDMRVRVFFGGFQDTCIHHTCIHKRQIYFCVYFAV